MTYISFDEFSEDTLRKQREEQFISGTNGEKLAQLITDSHDKHNKNVASLKHTVHLFAGNELKKRSRSQLAYRLEQEQKWAKHYALCMSEHKKGLIVARLKAEIEVNKALAAKKAAEVRAATELRIEELRKTVRATARAEYEAELKAKKEAAAKEHKEEPKNGTFWGWLTGLFKTKKPAAKKPVPVPAAAQVAKALVNSGENAQKDRKFYELDSAARKARIEELKKKMAENKKAA